MLDVSVQFWINFIYINNMVTGCLTMTLAVSKNVPNTINLYTIDLITIPCTDHETVTKSTIISNISFSGLYHSMAFNPWQNRLYFINNDVIFSESLNGTSLKRHHDAKIVAFDLDIGRQLLIYASAALASFGPNRYFLEQSSIGSNLKQTILGDLATVVTVIADAVNQRVFWTSISFDTSIESISYDGSNRIKHVRSSMANLLNVDAYSEIIYYSKLGSLRYQRYNESKSTKVDQSVKALVCLSTGRVLIGHGNKLKLINFSIDNGASTIYSDDGGDIRKISVISDCPMTSTSDPSPLEISTTGTERTTKHSLELTTNSTSTYKAIFSRTTSYQLITDVIPNKAPVTYSTPTITVIVIVSVLAICMIAIAVTLTVFTRLRKSKRRTIITNTEILYDDEMPL